jgi:hypothetical protein
VQVGREKRKREEEAKEIDLVADPRMETVA